MLRKIIMIICVCLMACVSMAKPRAYVLNIPMGTNTTATKTFGGEAGISGSVDSIVIAASDGISTGSVWVAYDPMDTYTANVNMATNVVVGSKTFRPRLDGTSVAGAALANDTADNKHMLVGEDVNVIVSGNLLTGVTWRVTIKVDE